MMKIILFSLSPVLDLVIDVSMQQASFQGRAYALCFSQFGIFSRLFWLLYNQC